MFTKVTQQSVVDLGKEPRHIGSGEETSACSAHQWLRLSQVCVFLHRPCPVTHNWTWRLCLEEAQKGRCRCTGRQAGVCPASSAAWGMEACLELGGGVKRREDLQGGEGWFVLSRRMRRKFQPSTRSVLSMHGRWADEGGERSWW